MRLKYFTFTCLFILGIIGFNGCVSTRQQKAVSSRGATIKTATIKPKSTLKVDPRPVSANPNLVYIDRQEPYFETVAGGQAARALSMDLIKEAKIAFEKIAVEQGDTPLGLRAQFLSAYLAGRLGKHKSAYTALLPLVEKLPILSNTILVEAASSAFHLKKWDEAIQLASKVSPSSVVTPVSHLMWADALREKKRYAEAREKYEKYLADWPNSPYEVRIKSALVHCLKEITGPSNTEKSLIARPSASEDKQPSASEDKQPSASEDKQPSASEDKQPSESEKEPNADTKNTRIEQALKLLDWLKSEHPNNRWTKAALAYETILLRRLGKKPKKQKSETKAALDAYKKAYNLLKLKKNEKAERAFGKVIRLARKNGVLSCKAQLEQARAVSWQRKHGEAAKLFAEVSKKCGPGFVQVRALLLGGKAYTTVGKYRDAISLFSQIEQQYPNHSYADDARLLAAKCQLAMGNKTRFIEMVTSIPSVYPKGDMRSEALWLAAKESLESNDLEGAQKILDNYHTTFPVERHWYRAGRSGYWLARVSEFLGQTEKANQIYEQVVATSPLSHYMTLAFNRLKKTDPQKAILLLDHLAPKAGRGELAFEKGLFKKVPGFAEALELLKLGLTTRAKKAFKHLSKQPDVPTDIFWISSALLRKMGQYSAGKDALNGGNDIWRTRYPAGKDYINWTLAYPRAFETQVEEAAAESGVDRALIWAVMREESGFNKKITSWANAMGLMQLIWPTARSMAAQLNIPITKKSLKDPTINIRLGAAYLAYLKTVLGDHPVFLIAGYNAGEGAVRRWLHENPDAQLDLFVEKITYKQTRGYTKRVLSSYAVYNFLYNTNADVLDLKMTLSSK